MASRHLIENVVLEAQGGAVLSVAWPLPSGSASGPLRILNETSGSSSHTPEIWTITQHAPH